MLKKPWPDEGTRISVEVVRGKVTLDTLTQVVRYASRYGAAGPSPPVIEYRARRYTLLGKPGAYYIDTENPIPTREERYEATTGALKRRQRARARELALRIYGRLGRPLPATPAEFETLEQVTDMIAGELA